MGTTQSSYTAHSILGIGNKCTICGGKRPKKVKIVTKIEKKRCIGSHVTEKTHVCMYHSFASVPG